MKKLLTYSMAAAAAVIPAQAYAQKTYAPDDESVVTVIVGDKNAAPDVEEQFIFNAPANRKIAGLPRFAIVGNEGKFYLGIGAQFLGEAMFDWGDQMPSAYSFAPSSMTPKTPGNGGALRFTAQTSTIYMNFVGMPGSENRVGLYFQANLQGGGNNYALQLGHFYAKWRGLTAGWTSSFFEDGAAIPFTIDDEGPNGSVEYKTFVVGWRQDFNSKLSGGIGIDAPSVNYTTNHETASVSQRLPSIPLYLQYAWNDNSHFRLSAIVRPIQYRNLPEAENKTLTGWGVQASGMAQIVDGLTFYYDATYGRGISDYLQDDNGLGLDAVPKLVGHRASELTTAESLGLTAGLGMQFTPKLAGNVSFSHVTNWRPEDGVISGDTYRYGDYAAANLYYNVNKIVSVGLEYDYGHSKTFDGRTSLTSNRLQAQLAVTF